MSEHVKITFANGQVLTTGGDTSIRMQAVDDSDSDSELNNISELSQEMADLEDLRRSVEMAWERFDALYDRWLTRLGVSIDTVEAAEYIAIKAQQYYFHKYYELHSDQCTCKPDDAIACDVCQAQIKAKSIYREEL